MSAQAAADAVAARARFSWSSPFLPAVIIEGTSVPLPIIAVDALIAPVFGEAVQIGGDAGYWSQSAPIRDERGERAIAQAELNYRGYIEPRAQLAPASAAEAQIEQGAGRGGSDS